MRILIVNGGRGMRQGATVAGQLGELAKQDPSLVGVVGLDMSSQPTADTINALSDAGLPMVSAPLSEDSLAVNHPMYFQVAPQNSREAAMAAAFAGQRVDSDPSIPRTVRIYYSDEATDTYSTNLRADAVAAFRAKGFTVEAKAFIPSGPAVTQSAHAKLGDPLVDNANSAGRDTCRYNGFAFFAGRGVPDYGDFLGGANQCLSKAVFIGDDDVSRYVADATEREGNRALSFYYVSFAFAPPPISPIPAAASDFYHTLNTVFPFEQDHSHSRSLDGHAALSYDAANVLITAVSYLRSGSERIPITPGTVWREITDIHASPIQQRFIEGVSGTIDYGGDIRRQVPLSKPVAILRVSDGEVEPAVAGLCGNASGQPTSSWCPQGD